MFPFDDVIMETSILPCCHNLAKYNITYTTAVTDAEYKSDLEIMKDIQYFALTVCGGFWR